MRVEYSKRATADLCKVSEESRAFGEMVAAAVEVRIRFDLSQGLVHVRRVTSGRPAKA